MKIKITEENKKRIEQFLNSAVPNAILETIDDKDKEIEIDELVDEFNEHRKDLLKSDKSFIDEVTNERIHGKVAELRKGADQTIRKIFGLKSSQTKDKKWEDVLEEEVGKIRNAEEEELETWKTKFESLSTEFDSFKEEKEGEIETIKTNWETKFAKKEADDFLESEINKLAEKATKNTPFKTVKKLIKVDFNSEFGLKKNEQGNYQLTDKDGNFVQDGKDYVKIEEKLMSLLSANGLEAKNNNSGHSQQQSNSSNSSSSEDGNDDNLSALERAKAALAAEAE